MTTRAIADILTSISALDIFQGNIGRDDHDITIRHQMAVFKLIFLLLVISLLILGLIFALIKLRPAYFLFLLSVAIVIPVALFKNYENAFKLSVVPDTLKVKSVSYTEEEAWGFGPGGNEAGIRIYPLSDEIANKILDQGIEFFSNLPPNFNQQNRKSRGMYNSWNNTPVKEERGWKNGEAGKLNIYSYICKHGFCIDIDPEIVRKTNEVVNSEGSYYAYGRIGMIVVCPNQNLVIYMYNG